MAAALGLWAVLAASIGTIHPGHDAARADCVDCGVEDAAVREKVEKLRTASLWMVRRKAARSLRGYDWRRHPEAVEALAGALLHDRQCLVRQEAAESLGKMGSCLAVAHMALAKASECDSSLIARLAARKALKSAGKSCECDCEVCGPDSDQGDEIPMFPTEPGEATFPALPETSYIVPETTLEPLGPGTRVVPIAPPTPSPFVPPDATLPDRPPVGPSRFDAEDVRPLAPPVVPIDRYNPSPSQPAPAPLGDDVPAPRAAWPSTPRRVGASAGIIPLPGSGGSGRGVGR